MVFVVNVGELAGRLATSPAASDIDVNSRITVWAVDEGVMLVKGTSEVAGHINNKRVHARPLHQPWAWSAQWRVGAVGTPPRLNGRKAGEKA